MISQTTPDVFLLPYRNEYDIIYLNADKDISLSDILEYTMNNEHYPEPPDTLSLEYLDQDLVSAIDYGDKDAIEAALDQQTKNEVTVALSNHLIARSFLVRQKSKLVILENVLASGAQEEEITDLIQLLLDVLEEDYGSTFVTEEKNDMYGKLSGDDAFREFIAMADDEDVDDEGIDDENFISSVAEAKFRLIETNAAFLDSPEETLEWVKDMEDAIIFSMQGIRDQLQRTGVTEQNIVWARQEILTQIDSLDSHTLRCFPEL